ncbi:Protein LCHN [Golovinomyces cichoracearum]|uniref:Protein LCHN n=1 Tax=Golovinomyces cichoracearum TaxID=62708 RepID=A0A420IKT7_9PEZI|nr:Protein LCHN [Golovinomyces cichoracearum]
MAKFLKRQVPMNFDVSSNFNTTELPPLSALFLIYFDNKAGYSIGWKRSLPGVEIEGIVEFKSLPSGLHSVKQDLIYFVHDNHVGLSAFVNVPAAEESRNACMIAVGVMLPQTEGKLGRCWEHAEEIKAMARTLINDTSLTKVLQEYWDTHKASNLSIGISESHLASLNGFGFKSLPSTPRQPKCHKRARSLSDAEISKANSSALFSHHPVKSIVKLIETFGPLIFPIYRAALLRKKILITTHAPVHEACNFVYDISILSSIPLTIRNLEEFNVSREPLQPLFSIGVHDIGFLEEDLRNSKKSSNTSESNNLGDKNPSARGWVACTTDSILAMKNNLYDVLVEMPPTYSKDDTKKNWPRLESPPGIELRATRRDFRRYKSLMSKLSLHNSSLQKPNHVNLDTSLETESLFKSSSGTSVSENAYLSHLPDIENIIEPMTWSELLHSSLTWIADGAEQRSSLCSESESESSLFSGLSFSPTSRLLYRPNNDSKDRMRCLDELDKPEMTIITYFHRLTTQILTTLEKVTETNELEDDIDDENNPLQCNSLDSDYESRAPIFVSSSDVVNMGLDIWSNSDYQFIQNLARLYTGRRSLVEELKLEMCGVRIC